MSTRKQPQTGLNNELVLILREFYSTLWGTLDSLYPGFLSASGGPQRKDEPSGLPKAKVLLEKLLDEAKLDPELRETIKNDMLAQQHSWRNTRDSPVSRRLLGHKNTKVITNIFSEEPRNTLG